MADCNEENSVPSISENADKILFVEEIVEYVMLRNCPNHVSECDPKALRECFHMHFDQDTESAVFHLSNISERDNVDLLNTIQHTNVCSKDYMTIAQDMAEYYIPDNSNFDARLFLRYCVGLSRLAAEFYKRGVLNTPELAKTYILKILQEYNMTSFEWDALHKFTSSYANVMRLKKLERKIMSSDDESGFNSEINPEIIFEEIETFNETDYDVNIEELKSISLTQE